MGKRNLKKEKAERNKAYARQFRKKTNPRYNSKRRNYNSPSENNEDSNNNNDQNSQQN